jgi:hypothetical protein
MGILDENGFEVCRADMYKLGFVASVKSKVNSP